MTAHSQHSGYVLGILLGVNSNKQKKDFSHGWLSPFFL